MKVYPTQCTLCEDNQIRHEMIDGRLSLSTKPFIGKSPRIVLLGQDPTVTRGCASVVLDLDNPRSNLAKWINETILNPLDLVTDDLYATNAVKCCFPRRPRLIAKENRIPLGDFLSPFFNHCKDHLVRELLSFNKTILIPLGEPTHQLLKSTFGWNVPFRMKTAFGSCYSVSLQNKEFFYIPCVHYNTWKLQPFYRGNLDRFLNTFKKILIQTNAKLFDPHKHL